MPPTGLLGLVTWGLWSGYCQANLKENVHAYDSSIVQALHSQKQLARWAVDVTAILCLLVNQLTQVVFLITMSCK